MSKDKLTDYSATNASNTDIGGINIDEGMLPSDVNNALREVMTHLKDFAEGTQAVNNISFAGATTTGDINFGDNDKAVFGAGSDLQIYHDGGTSIIADAGTGNLQLRANDFQLTNAAATQNIIRGYDSTGAVGLHYGGSEKLATTSGGIDVTGTVTAQAPTATDGLITVKGASGDFSGGIALVADAGENATDWFRIASIQSGSSHDLRISISSDTTPTWDTHFLNINSGGDISFYDNTGTTQGLFWDASTQSLGLGTTSPASPLEAIVTTSASVETALTLSSTGNSNGDGAAVSFNRVGAERAKIGAPKNETSNNDTDLTFSVTNPIATLYEAMRIEGSSGNVGIGTSSPLSKMHIEGGDSGASVFTDTYLTVENSGDTRIAILSGTTGIGGIKFGDSGLNRQGGIDYIHSSDAMTFATTNAERMRIDSGALLVGKTSNDATTVGANIRADKSFFTSSGQEALVLNRNTSDGTILELRKANATAGTIGGGSGFLTIGSSTGNLAFFTGLVLPTASSSGATSNGVIDLGNSSNRFKDLYLSGGAYLGGTAAANKLDSYEDGSWNPTLITGSGTPTFSYNVRGGNYTKIGNKVIAWFYADISVTVAGAGQSGVAVSSLPFSPASDSLTSSAYTRGGFVTAHPTGTNTSAMGFNNINPASATVAYFQGLAQDGGDSTAGLQTGVYAGYLIYEAT